MAPSPNVTSLGFGVVEVHRGRGAAGAVQVVLEPLHHAQAVIQARCGAAVAVLFAGIVHPRRTVAGPRLSESGFLVVLKGKE